MTVILPQPTQAQIGMTGVTSDDPPPILYLLHGLSDDDTIWLRRTAIERYAAELGLTVVMPAVGRSFYTDEALGLPYWTFIAEELPALVHRFLRVSAAPTGTFVAGLSMGGYGAMKLALRHPDRFAAAASLSGVLDLSELSEWSWPEDPRMNARIFGPDGPSRADNPLELITHADPGGLPALWVGCGTRDPLYAGNLAFVATARARGIPITTSWTEDADHTWDLWDNEIEKVLAWLPLPGRPPVSRE